MLFNSFVVIVPVFYMSPMQYFSLLLPKDSYINFRTEDIKDRCHQRADNETIRSM